MQTVYSTLELKYATVAYWFMNISLFYSIFTSCYRFFSNFSLHGNYLNRTEIKCLILNFATSSVAAVISFLMIFLVMIRKWRVKKKVLKSSIFWASNVWWIHFFKLLTLAFTCHVRWHVYPYNIFPWFNYS